MEFDKSRVYTALNADELPIGSRCVFADTIHDLRKKVESDSVQRFVYVLRSICDSSKMERFEEDDNAVFLLAYLIEPPVEPKYKPFESVEKAIEASKKHGGWVKDKKNNVQLLVVGFDDDNGFFLGNGYSCSYTVLFLDYVFADDGSPCGELVEE
ncbi:hypothetical protein ABH09_04730 [Treponema sp. OMZ 803]|uniref:hypothetical protein n=1 Tax=Treponema sp. OMZ 803 TaxID=120682 RepID=UPI0020A3BA61|nr:hypothetical protein [Treponema sp. OMZ 803]UTC53957.1 hypothetical protein ABH09_04730 [Treponema sp. OMZ 803]